LLNNLGDGFSGLGLQPVVGINKLAMTRACQLQTNGGFPTAAGAN
jgi:hypothetical protein